MAGPAGIQEETSCTAGEDAWRFGENTDGRWQSYSRSDDDHRL